jgi:predicted NBD/HSP70 family sugar kinase
MAGVLSLAAAGDAGVCRLLRDLGRALGRSLADFWVYLAPDGIVLDGLLGRASAPALIGASSGRWLGATGQPGSKQVKQRTMGTNGWP